MAACTVLLTLATVLVQQHCWSHAFDSGSLLENDILAALSWATLGIDPSSLVETSENDTTNSFYNKSVTLINGSNGDVDDCRQCNTSTYDMNPRRKREMQHREHDLSSDTDLKPTANKQTINLQGMIPTLACELRLVRMKVFQIHDDTYFTVFLGVKGTPADLHDIFHIKGRNRDNGLLSSLEDIVGLLGVDGEACVHRMLCELGGSSSRMLRGGLFWELADISIRRILNAESSDVQNDGRTSTVSYLDAVAAGRHGSDCGLTFNKCPLSLMSMSKFFELKPTPPDE